MWAGIEHVNVYVVLPGFREASLTHRRRRRRRLRYRLYPAARLRTDGTAARRRTDVTFLWLSGWLFGVDVGVGPSYAA